MSGGQWSGFTLPSVVKPWIAPPCIFNGPYPLLTWPPQASAALTVADGFSQRGGEVTADEMKRMSCWTLTEKSSRGWRGIKDHRAAGVLSLTSSSSSAPLSTLCRELVVRSGGNTPGRRDPGDVTGKSPLLTCGWEHLEEMLSVSVNRQCAGWEDSQSRAAWRRKRINQATSRLPRSSLVCYSFKLIQCISSEAASDEMFLIF